MKNIYEAVPGLVVSNKEQSEKALAWLFHYTENREWNSGYKLLRLVQEHRNGRLQPEAMTKEDQEHPELILLNRLLQFESRSTV